MSDKENGEAEGEIRTLKREFPSYLLSSDRPTMNIPNLPMKQRRLFENIEEPEEEDSEPESVVTTATEHSTDHSTDRSSAEQGALVYLRIRPVVNPSAVFALSSCGSSLIVSPSEESASTSNNKNQMEKHFSFTSIFDGNMQQREVFNICVGNKIEQEESFTLMTYGTSGSGKTYTLLGDVDAPGVIPRSLVNIFTQYAENIYKSPAIKVVNARPEILDDYTIKKEMQLRSQLLKSCIEFQAQNLNARVQSEHNFQTIDYGENSVFIWISYVEIYNENVYDLLEMPPTGPSNLHSTLLTRKNLKIMCNDGKAFIKSLTSVYVRNSKEAVQLLHLGRQKANYASTNINENSSRSHCVFIVDVLRFDNNTGEVSEMCYKFCDLAGSERLDKTGNKGSRLKEAQRINTSLLVLGRCLDAANSNNRSIRKQADVIPFRDSKLTMLLQSALLGREKLSMIVNITPTNNYYEENLHVLSFASIAKNIIYKQPTRKPYNSSRYSCFLQQSHSASALANENRQILQLKEENARLCYELELAKIQNESLRAEITKMQSICEEEKMELENALRNQLVDDFEKELKKRKADYERDLESAVNKLKRAHEDEIIFLKRKHAAEIEDVLQRTSGDESIEEVLVVDEELPR